MKQTHSQLHMESVCPGKASHRRKVSGDCLEISSPSRSELVMFSFHLMQKQSEFIMKEFLGWDIRNIGHNAQQYILFLFWSFIVSHFKNLNILFFVLLYYQEESYLKEIKLTVEILRSALYRNDECKVSLYVLPFNSLLLIVF